MPERVLAGLHAPDQLGGAELVTMFLVVRRDGIAEWPRVGAGEGDAGILHLLLEALFAGGRLGALPGEALRGRVQRRLLDRLGQASEPLLADQERIDDEDVPGVGGEPGLLVKLGIERSL